MAYRKKRYSAPRYKKRKYARKGRKCKVTKCVKKYVKSTLHRNIENKFYTSEAQNQVIYCANSNQTPVMFDLIPTIAQGSTESQRIGNKIKIMSAVMKICVNLSPYDAIYNGTGGSCYIKFWVVSNNQRNDATAPTSAEMLTFFKANNSTAPFAGSILDLERVVDTNFKVHTSKVVRLSVTPTTNTNIYTSIYGLNDSSPGSAMVTLPIGKYLNTLKYNDTTSTYVIGKNLWLVTTAVYANGTIVSTNLIKPAQMTYSIVWNYEDA